MATLDEAKKLFLHLRARQLKLANLWILQ